MTVAVDDHNLKSLEKDDQTHQCENNGHLSVQVELERRPDDVELPVVFSSKDEAGFISTENCDAHKPRHVHEVHFNDDDLNSSSECDQNGDDEQHQLKKQHSQISNSLLSQHQSFRLTHRTSFLSSCKISRNDVDDTDSLPETMSFTRLDEFCLIFSITTFLLDIITDLTVATNHYLNSDYYYFSFTVAFIAFPAFVMTCINLRWYIVDANEPNSPKATKKQWCIRVLILSLQLGPVMRYYDSIKFGRNFRNFKSRHGTKSKMARKYFQYMIYEDADATMLRLFECFLEAAPQLILQMYILAVSKRSYQNDLVVVVQMFSVVASLISLSWSLVSYLRILRMSLPTKVNMSWPGTIVHFFWRLFMIASRVLALALFASQFTYYIGIVCLCHWLVMFLWIISMKTAFCNDNRLEELFYNAVLGVIFIFCYFNPVDSPTRRRYSFYYSFIFIENSLLMLLWYRACDVNKWYRLPGFASFFVCFFLGLVFMVIYYLTLHPTNNIGLFRSSVKSIPQPPVQPRFVYSISQANVEENGLPVTAPENSAKYKRQISDVWTTHGRLLHPRPTINNRIAVHS